MVHTHGMRDCWKSSLLFFLFSKNKIKGSERKKERKKKRDKCLQWTKAEDIFFAS